MGVTSQGLEEVCPTNSANFHQILLNPRLNFNNLNLNLNNLNLNLEIASKENKVTMVYFTADWCVSCRRLEKNTFSDKNLQAKINNINAIKIDLTDNSIDDQLLIKSYSIFGPPTILFFDSNGVASNHSADRVHTAA